MFKTGQIVQDRQFKNLSKEAMDGRRIVAMVGLPPKKVGPYVSECLVLGTPGNAVGGNLGHYPLAPDAASEVGSEVR